MDKLKPVMVKPNIKFEDLEKLDIRVGTIEKVVDIEKSELVTQMGLSLFWHYLKNLFQMEQGLGR